MELVMQVSRAVDDRLSGSITRPPEADVRRFSGTLELMRVLEDLVSADDAPAATDAGVGS